MEKNLNYSTPYIFSVYIQSIKQTRSLKLWAWVPSFLYITCACVYHLAQSKVGLTVSASGSSLQGQLFFWPQWFFFSAVLVHSLFLIFFFYLRDDLCYTIELFYCEWRCSDRLIPLSPCPPHTHPQRCWL